MIYLQVHLNQSEKQLIEFVKKYNHELEILCMKQNAKLVEERKEPTVSFRKQSIKATHINTGIRILRAFYKHLQNIEKAGIAPEDVENIAFRINNEAIATMTNMHPTTAWRHITALVKCGAITKGKWHGTNSSYEISINPEILVAAPNFSFTNKLLTEAKKLTGSESLPDNLTEKLICLTPSFSDAPTGIIASCNYIASEKLQELNINMEVGIPMKNRDEILFASQKLEQKHEQESITTSENTNSNTSGHSCNSEKTQTRHETGGAPQSPKISNNTKLLFLYIQLAWDFAHSCLYENKYFDVTDIEAAKKFIFQYFHPTSLTEKPKFAALFNQFCERLQLARRYALKNPERFIPNPALYFDPRFEFGFRGTRIWYEKSIEQRRKNKEWNANMKLLSTLFRDFKLHPTVENYRVATQRLGKLRKNKEEDKNIFLDLFNTCVINPFAFNREIIENIRKNAA